MGLLLPVAFLGGSDRGILRGVLNRCVWANLLRPLSRYKYTRVIDFIEI